MIIIPLQLQHEVIFLEQYFPVLKSCPLFQGIEERQYAALLDCLGARVHSCDKGKAILHAGDAATQVGVVLTGSVQVCREDADGNRAIMAAIDPGGMFGEAYACAHTPSLPVSVWAAERCSILLLSLDKVTTVCSSACAYHNLLIANLLRVLAQKNVFLTGKMEHLGKRTLREKLLSYLRSQETAAGRAFSIPFDRQALADYLCADRSALSRELGNLQRDGVVEFEKNRFRFL